MTSSKARRVGACLACFAMLTGCGGGGGTDDPTGESRQPPATSVADDFPTGERQAVGAAEYLPFASNGTWVYARSEPFGPKTGEVTVRSTPLGNDRYAVSDTADDDTTLTIYTRTERGWEINVQELLDLPASASVLLSGFLIYPARFPADYQTSTQTRRGSLGTDLDGDGIDEGIEVRVLQIGFDHTVTTGPAGTVPAQRVVTTLTARLLPSNTRAEDLWAELEQTEWLVEGVGAVRVEIRLRTSTDEAFAVEVRTLESVNIDGVDPFASP